MNKPEMRPGLAHILKKPSSPERNRAITSFKSARNKQKREAEEWRKKIKKKKKKSWKIKASNFVAEVASAASSLIHKLENKQARLEPDLSWILNFVSSWGASATKLWVTGNWWGIVL